MKLSTQENGAWLHVIVDGNIDHENAQEFSSEILSWIDRGRSRLRLDLSQCDFISSSGLGSIAAALMVARSRGGDIEVLNPGHNVRNLFRTTKLNTIITMLKSGE